MEKSILNEQIIRMRQMMGLTESAKDQFKKDLQDDPDYKAFKDKAMVPGKNGGVEYSYGVVNPDNDPFINKTSQDDDSIELEEGTLYNVSGVHYDEMAKAEIGLVVGDLHKIAPYVLEIGDKVKMRADGAVEVSEEGRIVKIFRDLKGFLAGIRYGATPVSEDHDDVMTNNTNHIHEGDSTQINTIGIVSRRGKMMPAFFERFGLSVVGDLIEFDNNGKLLKQGGGYPEGGFKKHTSVEELEKDICNNYEEMLDLLKSRAPIEVELGENEGSYQIIKTNVNCDLY